MSKNKGNSAETVAADGAVNFTLNKHGVHPASNPNRTSYTIPGNPGNLVIFNSLFADGVAPDTLTLSVPVVSPKADNKEAKAAAAAARVIERAEKAAAREAARLEKARLKAEKAAAVIAAAQAKIDAAAATKQ